MVELPGNRQTKNKIIGLPMERLLLNKKSIKIVLNSEAEVLQYIKYVLRAEVFYATVHY